MLKVILAITLAILVFAGCGMNTAPNNDSASNGDTTSAANVKNEENETLKSEEEIKKIALSKVEGATEENIRKFHKDRDDGRWEYEVEIILDKTEYEFEIDAQTGEIKSWDQESIHD